MKIDYMRNSSTIVAIFKILYDGGRRELEGWIQGRGEEGIEGVNWFDGQVRYPASERIPHGCEIGGVRETQEYLKLRKGFPTQEQTEDQMRAWIDSFGLTISHIVREKRI